MPRTKSPCYVCTNRTLHCHEGCTLYEEWKARDRAGKTKPQGDKDAEQFLGNQFARHKKLPDCRLKRRN